ncbi:MAG: polysaccharide biosynthesis/export family protein [Deltaproteobacteria bacterium]|nr:polysaccharide biosynthesis/export family protein [Deltaproteobacteria bacterium]
MRRNRNAGRGIVGMLLGGLCLSLLAGCVGPKTTPPPEEVPGEREEYVIGIPDVLKIVVWRNPELSVEVPVRRDGKISVPLVDDVQAEGLTPEELKEVLTEALAEFVTAPDVTVVVQETNSHTVTVVGGVARSGQIALTRQMRVVEAIATMGGFSPFARKDRIKVIRANADGQNVEFDFNYGAYSRGKAPESNLLLQPGDTIIVPE